jgi:hypothetical protein
MTMPPDDSDHEENPEGAHYDGVNTASHPGAPVVTAQVPDDVSGDVPIGLDDHAPDSPAADNTAKEQQKSVFQEGKGGGTAEFTDGVHKQAAGEQVAADGSAVAGDEADDPSKEGAVTVGDMSDEYTAKAKRGKPFKKGQSGNPTGRPLGARNKATLAAEKLIEGDVDMLTRGMLELAQSGEIKALRYCLDRIIPPLQTEKITFELPSIKSVEEIPAAIAAVISGVAAGKILHQHADVLLRLIATLQKSFGQTEYEQRLSFLESQYDFNHGFSPRRGG